MTSTVVASTYRFSATAAIFGTIGLCVHFGINQKGRIYINIFLFAARLFINCEVRNTQIFLGGGVNMKV